MACGCGKKNAQRRAETPRSERRAAKAPATPRRLRAEPTATAAPPKKLRSRRTVIYEVTPRAGGDAVPFDRLEEARDYARQTSGTVTISRH